MTITVEDGTIVANADSYQSVAGADAYFTEHGDPSTWSDATTAAKEGALKYATRWLDNNHTWYSCIISTSQVLGHPRAAFTDTEGRSIAGPDTMATALLEATAEMANEHLQTAVNESVGNKRRERIGSSEVEYTGAGATRAYAYIHGIVSELGRKKSAGRRIRKGG